MPSLSEVYEGRGRAVSLRRLTFGLVVFAVGSLLAVAGVVVATTGLVYGSDIAALTAKRQLGGVLAGVGVPAVFLGIFTILPSGRLTKAAAVVGAGIGVVSVALFTHAYPCRWSGSVCGAGKPNLTLATVGLYSLGVFLTFWCLFVGVANFTKRNDPGGTAMVNVTRGRETRHDSVEKSDRRSGADGDGGGTGTGGVGFLGVTPDGEVATQTGGTETTSDGGTAADRVTSPLNGSSAHGASSEPGGTPRSEHDRSGSRGGTASPDAAVGDVYCGNCARFEYVRTDDGIQPYCGAHDELMDDMEPCEEWASRSEQR